MAAAGTGRRTDGRPACGASGSTAPTVFLGPNRHLVAYPVRGGELITFVAHVADPEWTLESWSARSEPAEAVAAFAG